MGLKFLLGPIIGARSAPAASRPTHPAVIPCLDHEPRSPLLRSTLAAPYTGTGCRRGSRRSYLSCPPSARSCATQQPVGGGSGFIRVCLPPTISDDLDLRLHGDRRNLRLRLSPSGARVAISHADFLALDQSHHRSTHLQHAGCRYCRAL